jgi:hypothetical protein
LRSSGLQHARVRHRPRLLSDNGPSYLSAQLGSWLEEHGLTHTRGKPYHPMTQRKIERYHRSMKNQILLENYYLPSQLEERLAEFVDYYNRRRYHESLNNLPPADVFFGRGQTILTRRQNIKLKTIELRRRLHHASAASTSTLMGQLSLNSIAKLSKFLTTYTHAAPITSSVLSVKRTPTWTRLAVPSPSSPIRPNPAGLAYRLSARACSGTSPWAIPTRARR